MFGDFKLSKVIGKYFGDAFDLFQKGAAVYGALTEDDQKEQTGFMRPGDGRLFNFDSNLRSARPTPQFMEAPIGLKAPNIQAAFRYFADNTARDTNLQSIRAANFKASISKKRQNVRPNFSPGGFGNAGMGSARSNRVGRARFRSHLAS